MAKCPPGKICFEPYMFVLLFLCIIIIFGYVYNNQYSINNKNTENLYSEIDLLKKKTTKLDKINNELENINSKLNRKKIDIDYELPLRETYLFNNNLDRIVNPLRPPLRSPSYTSGLAIKFDDVGLPINIPTRGLSPEFQQIGLLFRENDQKNVLPLFGKKLYNGSSKWWYYTIANQYNSVKIPLKYKNRDCQGDFGCDELSDNDEVFIPIYNNSFKVKIYQNDQLRYIPY